MNATIEKITNGTKVYLILDEPNADIDALAGRRVEIDLREIPSEKCSAATHKAIEDMMQDARVQTKFGVADYESCRAALKKSIGVTTLSAITQDKGNKILDKLKGLL